jgi:hypothetical protein
MSAYQGLFSLCLMFFKNVLPRLVLVPVGVIVGLLTFGFIDLLTTSLAFPVVTSIGVLTGAGTLLFRLSDTKRQSAYQAHPSQR